MWRQSSRGGVWGRVEALRQRIAKLEREAALEDRMRARGHLVHSDRPRERIEAAEAEILELLASAERAIAAASSAAVRRRRTMQLYGSFYAELDGPSCVYCDGPSAVKDHVPALAVFARWAREGRLLSGLLVPSCVRCNAQLGQRELNSVPERRAFIASRAAKSRRF